MALSRKLGMFLVMIVLMFSAYFTMTGCRNDPACACKRAEPGDPTCMSSEALRTWCRSQVNGGALPQCHF